MFDSFYIYIYINIQQLLISSDISFEHVPLILRTHGTSKSPVQVVMALTSVGFGDIVPVGTGRLLPFFFCSFFFWSQKVKMKPYETIFFDTIW